jgi:hypothetical protein
MPKKKKKRDGVFGSSRQRRSPPGENTHPAKIHFHDEQILVWRVVSPSLFFWCEGRVVFFFCA